MFFNKNKKLKCEKCKSGIQEDFSFCPYCGNPMLDAEKVRKDFGILGRSDVIEEDFMNIPLEPQNGITDKLIESLMNGLMKTMEKQFKEVSRGQNPEIRNLPNGIKISIGSQQPKKTNKKSQQSTVSESQLKRMSELPRATAKTNVRRLSDKVVYELAIPGIESPEDVFVSKLEQGYEIKAIAKKKVYINSLPLELPIKGFAIDPTKLSVEFKTQIE